MLRFNLQQLLLLIVLAAIFGGYLTSASSRSLNFTVVSMDVSPDQSRLVCAGSDGIQLIDLHSGASRMISLHQTEDWISYVASSDVSIRFVDNDSFVIVRNSYGSDQGQELRLYYSSSLELVRQTMVMPRFSPGRGSAAPGELITAFWEQSGRSYSFYETGSGRRIPFRGELKGQIESMSASRDGRYVVARIRENSQLKHKVIDLATNRIQTEWDDRLALFGYQYGSWLNADGSRVLVVNRSACELVDTADGSVVRTVEFKGPAGGSDVTLSDDGSVFYVIGKSTPPSLTTVDSTTGELKSVVTLELDIDDIAVRPVRMSPDGASIYVAGRKSDNGATIIDAATGRKSSSRGWYPRRILPALFSLLFIFWAAVWGFFQRRSRARDMKDSLNPDSGEVADPFADEPVEAEVIPVQPEANLPWWMRNIENSLTTIRILMGVGGVVAILIAVVPSFFRYDSEFAFFVPTDYRALTLIWTTFGLIVGVWAAAAAFAGSKSMLRTVSALQILNLINCDIINGMIGIVQTVMLNMPVLRRYLDGPDSK